MLVHSFKVRAEAGSTQHEVSVSIPHYSEASAEQRLHAWKKAIASITIDVQRNLRKRLEKGLRGEALQAEARKLFSEALDAKRAGTAPSTVIDMALPVFAQLTADQITALEAQGALVVNKPSTDDIEGDAEDEEN